MAGGNGCYSRCRSARGRNQKRTYASRTFPERPWSSRRLIGPAIAATMHIATLMLLGSGELGREFAIAAKRLGCRVVACDRYENAPAMQVADAFEVFSMLDGKALRAAVETHKPDAIIPEIEAIDTETLVEAGRRRLERRAVGEGRSADHEPRRHSRVRRPRARPDHVALQVRRIPRRSHGCGRRGRPALRREAGHVELRQRPERLQSRRKMSAPRGIMPSRTCAATARV